MKFYTIKETKRGGFMSLNKAIAKSLKKIEEEINKTYDLIHTNSDKKQMYMVNMSIDKLHELKEMEFNIKQLM